MFNLILGGIKPYTCTVHPVKTDIKYKQGLLKGLLAPMRASPPPQPS